MTVAETVLTNPDGAPVLCAAREAALLRELGAQYPLGVRVLPDGSIAVLLDLLFTRAILLGCTPCGYGRRFCFADRAMASQRFAELLSEDDEPQGFIAQRGAPKLTGDLRHG